MFLREGIKRVNPFHGANIPAARGLVKEREEMADYAGACCEPSVAEDSPFGPVHVTRTVSPLGVVVAEPAYA
jgi:hypothetical protein